MFRTEDTEPTEVLKENGWVRAEETELTEAEGKGLV